MNAPPLLVLASTSPYRRALLERLGVPFEVADPGVDEPRLAHLPPLELARALAVAKAEAVATAPSDGSRRLYIGSDQVVDLDGEVLGKPGSEARAVAQLLRLAGRTHRLITAVAVHDPAGARTELAVDVHTLRMRALSREQVERYVALDRPVDCAGSYKLETRGIALFERVEADPETADSSAIVGLPLMKLCRLLRGFGYDIV